MRLNDIEVQADYFAVAGFIRHQRLAGRPVPDEVCRLFRRLELDISVGGSESECGEPELGADEIGTVEAAQILGCSERNVRLIAEDLEGRKIGRTWIFAKSVVQEYQEARRNA